MYRGLHSVGIGVSNMDVSLKFYSEVLGFSDIMFDYTGELPGMSKIIGKPTVCARVVMIANPNVALTANSMIRLVQILPPDNNSPIPEGIGWGEIGTAEVCIKVTGLAALQDKLKKEGYTIPVEKFELDGTWMFYVLDPDGGKVEILQSVGCDGSPRILGVFHAGVGVSDIEASAAYYAKLGLPLDLWDFEGIQEPMSKWYGHNQEMLEKLIGNLRGGTIEMIQLLPETKDCRGEWGHLGAMDYALETTNIERSVVELEKNGISALSDPVTIQTSSGDWKYVYLQEPDNNYVCLIEQRF